MDEHTLSAGSSQVNLTTSLTAPTTIIRNAGPQSQEQIFR